MKRLSLILILAMLITPVFAGDPHTTIPPVDAVETVVYTGLHPIKDKIDLATDKQATLNAELYTAWEKQTYPVKFTSEYGDAITIKKVEKKKDGVFGVYISATRGGKEVATHSPIWFPRDTPTVIVTDVTITSASAYTSTIKEDVVSVIQNTLGEYVHNTKLGKAEGDDVAIIYSSNDAVMTEGTDGTWPSPLRDDTGDGLAANPATSLLGGYTTASSTTDTYTQNERSGVNAMTGDALDDGITITDAKLSLYGSMRLKKLGTVNASLIDYTGTTSKRFIAQDYKNTSFTRLGDDITYDSFTTSGYNNFTIYPSQLSYISKIANTTIILDHAASVNNSALQWAYGSSNITGFTYKSTAASSGAYKPFWTITYTAGGTPDTTPPASITNLANTTATTCNSIVWTWTDPTDADFNEVVIYRNNTWFHNITKATQTDTWTGLPPSAAMTISTHTADVVGNINATWVNATLTTPECAAPPDTTPPGPVTDLTGIPSCDSIEWTWTPPADADFAGVAVYNQTGTGAWTRNVTANSDEWTSLAELTNYGIGTHTYDAVGNMDPDWVNASSKTSACGTAPVAAFTANNVSTCTGVPVVFTDQSTNSPTGWAWSFGEGNTSSSQNPSHTYGVTGSMTVALEATNAYGSDTETKTGYIAVTSCGSAPAGDTHAMWVYVRRFIP